MIEPRAKPLIKGLLSFVVPSLRSTHQPSVLGTGSSRYCYAVFLRHYSHLAQFTAGRLPEVIVELGPGYSLGTGLAGLIAGAERCIGLDLQNHMRVEDNLRIFDELVALFRARAPVPRDVEIATDPLDWAFPPSLAAGLERALDDRRIATIRRDIEDGTGRFVDLVAPWSDRAVLAPDSVGWLMSHAVMEHVDDVAAVYDNAATWLAPGGFMTHEIDFSSHQLTRHWNGHWAVPLPLWRMIRGARPYLINRLPLAGQLEAMRRQGFEVLREVVVMREDGLGQAGFAPTYAGVSDKDARTHIAFVVGRKPAAAAANARAA